MPLERYRGPSALSCLHLLADAPPTTLPCRPPCLCTMLELHRSLPLLCAPLPWGDPASFSYRSPWPPREDPRANPAWLTRGTPRGSSVRLRGAPPPPPPLPPGSSFAVSCLQRSVSPPSLFVHTFVVLLFSSHRCARVLLALLRYPRLRASRTTLVLLTRGGQLAPAYLPP